MKKRQTQTKIMLALMILTVVTALQLQAQSVRSRGMGGAFIAISDDESATFFNPAGLSQIHGREASIQSKVNERDIYEWTSLAFTGHIYEDEKRQGFSITDYLEHNVLQEPIARTPKYSYGVSYTVDKRNEEFGQLVGGQHLGTRRDLKDFQLAFATRFPIARNMMAREQLYGGVKFRFATVDRWIRSLQQHNKRDSRSMGIGLMYHYSDNITAGMTLDNLIESVKGTNAKEDGISVNFGAAIEITKGTLISADVINLTSSANHIDQQYRVGVEKKFAENDLTMRMGSLNGTLTLGFGMHILPNVRMDYSYYDGNIISEHHVGAHVTFD